MSAPRDDFYVGYLPAPRGIARFARRAAESIAILSILVALAATLAQQRPAPGRFPAGVDERISGVLLRGPAPLMLHVNEDQSTRWLIVVGERKFGADQLVGSALLGVWAVARGRIIGQPGSPTPGCLELSEGPDAVRPDTIFGRPLPEDTRVREEPLGRITLHGEIIDPKCHFGAMKPGSGKTHRGCAALCIAGGIPPVLRVQQLNGSAYYLLIGADGLPVNEAVLDYIAEPVVVEGNGARLLTPKGETVGDDSLRVLRIDPAAIRRR